LILTGPSFAVQGEQHVFYFLSIERNEGDSLVEGMLRGRQEKEKERSKKEGKLKE
jgi:hypothetical protein